MFREINIWRDYTAIIDYFSFLVDWLPISTVSENIEAFQDVSTTGGFKNIFIEKMSKHLDKYNIDFE